MTADGRPARYRVASFKGQPTDEAYVLRSHMTKADYLWNLLALRDETQALLRHYLALKKSAEAAFGPLDAALNDPHVFDAFEFDIRDEDEETEP